MQSLVVSQGVAQQKKDRERFVRMTRNTAQHRENKQPRKKASAADTTAKLCLILHELAQKYVPRTPQAFGDFNALLQVTRTLQKMGFNPQLTAELCAISAATETAVVLNSPEYRKLHNRFVAALATIADMTEKNTPPGSTEYQRGVREGYRRASDIAILFLEDLQIGAKK